MEFAAVLVRARGEAMSRMTRRNFLEASGAAALVSTLPAGLAASAVAGTSPPPLNPGTIPKYVTPLVVPPPMPATARGHVDHYEIAVRQFRQQVLPRGLPTTTVWGYGAVRDRGTFHAPGFTIEARYGREVRVSWINGLVDRHGRFLPHLLPVDPTLHWANPPGGIAGRDSEPAFANTPGRYRGPVPFVTHVHGAHAFDHSDGFAEAWYLPDAVDIPRSFARVGSAYNHFRRRSPLGSSWGPGRAVFTYPNDQPAATLWYHDHTLGMTRLNVYAGPAGFYLLRGGPGDLPRGVLPGAGSASGHYEIPMAIQDRSFSANGSLRYPGSREDFDGFSGPYEPDSDVSPIWNPEFFGDSLMVNGRTWPVLEVEPRRYRLRLLNGCNSRFLVLMIAARPAARPAAAALPIWVIGGDGGFLDAPVQLPQLLMGPAERMDTIVDFTGLRPGTELYLLNLGPDEPFGELLEPPEPDADPDTTGQVMKFRVVPLRSQDRTVPPDQLTLPGRRRSGGPARIRRLSLNELASTVPGFDGPAEALLGTYDAAGPHPLEWRDRVSENPAVDATEIWELHNFTQDAHPIHLHLVQFDVVGRQSMEPGSPTMPPEVWERGPKDTVIAYPGAITRIRATFDRPGLFVWHCHILEHEDNEMMRPYRVGR